MTERYDSTLIYVADQTIASPGATGNKTQSNRNDINAYPFGAVLIAPVLEEFFFHGALLVALYTVLRRPVGKLAAGIGALLVTTGAFVLVHGLAGTLGVDAIVGLVLVAGVGGALVLLTGRIWAAVLLHITYNAVFVALALVGTLFG